MKGACGYDNCAAITSDGKLYVWGGNSSDKLGLIDCDNEFEAVPRLVDSLSNVKVISCGFQHTAAINTNGELYTWGHGFFGQLGHGDNITKKEPRKVDFNDIKYIKVKCGSNQTVAIDKKGQVYVWGRGGINLNQDPSRHKKYPELIEDFKSTRIKSVQVGYGNTLILTYDKEIWGFGDNQDGKAGNNIDKCIYKNPKLIKIENENKKLIPIGKIFAGYSHSFAMSENGEIFGFGSSQCYRLTADFGDNQLKLPKLINLFSTGTNYMINEENTIIGNKKNQIDERFILARLEDKHTIPSFKELIVIIENDDRKYSDKNLIERDNDLQNQIIEGLNKLAANNEVLDTEKYIHLDKLLTLRMRHMKVPLNTQTRPDIPLDILNNMNEIEKIYTLFYLHPCFFKDYFEDEILPSNFYIFMNGIKPLFTELQTFSSKSENYDNIVFLTFFKILIDCDLKVYKKDIDKLYLKLNSYLELLIEKYFYNNFEKSILLEIFEKSLKDLYNVCKIHANKNMNKKLKGTNQNTIFNTIKSLKTIFIDPNMIKNEKDVFKKENVDELISIMKSFLNDFESNLNKLPIYVSYCLTMVKKRFYKLLITSKEIEKIKSDKAKIRKALLRLFFKNILARLLKKITAENKDFLKKQLDIKDDEEGVNAALIFDIYIIVVGEFLEKIATNKAFSLNDNEDKKDNEFFIQLNSNIKEFNNRITNIFRSKLLKSKYDIKRESLSSLIYCTTSPLVKKVRIGIKDLIEFLKLLNIAKSKTRQVLGLLDFTDYKVFDLFEISKSIKSDLSYDQSSKVTIYIDIRFLLDPVEFCKKYSSEVKFSGKNSETIINRCRLCNLVIPQCFILNLEKKMILLLKDLLIK